MPNMDERRREKKIGCEVKKRFIFLKNISKNVQVCKNFTNMNFVLLWEEKNTFVLDDRGESFR